MYTMSETTAVGISFARKTGYNIVVSALSGGVNILLNYLPIPAWNGTAPLWPREFPIWSFFWGRTLISRKIWYRFRLEKYLLYTVLILINCGLHTFVTGWAPYAVSAVSLVVTAAVNWRPLRSAYEFFRANA